ncbi:Gamma-glutamyltranspeptidase @ Glutathione hydrolase [hydrothermal vent metagenome]|uniref:Gamma-glutamyltranspeptidase @ Glutathione hydrolase n=1 Tax=hydrothermal vent metagenome TaxID=652676 RepID=A0A3B0WD25_9ZZZZ
MNKIFQTICFTVFIFFYPLASISQTADIDNAKQNHVSQAAVASAHPLATQAGINILKQGGNAFDAAVAVTAALAVVEPYSSGIGGGGFYLLHQAKNNKDVMLDARERAPFRAHKNLYLDEKGKVIPDASITGPLSAGIPGIPAALVLLAENYGVLKLSQSLASAIKYAENGFEVDAYYQKMAGFRLEALQKNKAASDIFLQNGEVPKLQYKIIQKDLAKTLRVIADFGFSGFYESELTLKMVKDVRKHGGIWTMKDLGSYEIKTRSPDVTIYKGMKLTSASLPSSGGLVLSEILQILAKFDLEKMDKAQRVHYIVEAMRRGYRDRAEYMGDPDLVDVPVDFLISELHIKSLAKTIDRKVATPSASLKTVAQPSGNGTDTTHFSIIDKQGNKVSATLSINYPFGSCFVAEGTGVLLNDEMDDFSAKPGVANIYGLVGSHANAIEPGKRMLSSMTPSFVETRDRFAVIGTPGGSRIITMVLLGILDFYENENADEIVNNGRFHHQYLPDEIFYEPDVFDEFLLDDLQALGHTTKALTSTYGNMQVLVLDKKSGKIDAASDARGIGSAEVLH